jgi:hypothetical protein
MLEGPEKFVCSILHTTAPIGSPRISRFSPWWSGGLDVSPWTILGAPLSVFEGGAVDFAFFLPSRIYRSITSISINPFSSFA